MLNAMYLWSLHVFFIYSQTCLNRTPVDRADRSVFRGVRFSQCWVFSAEVFMHTYLRSHVSVHQIKRS